MLFPFKPPFPSRISPHLSRGRHDSVHRIRWNGKANSSEGTRGARNHSVHTLLAIMAGLSVV